MRAQTTSQALYIQYAKETYCTLGDTGRPVVLVTSTSWNPEAEGAKHPNRDVDSFKAVVRMYRPGTSTEKLEVIMPHEFFARNTAESVEAFEGLLTQATSGNDLWMQELQRVKSLLQDSTKETISSFYLPIRIFVGMDRVHPVDVSLPLFSSPPPPLPLPSPSALFRHFCFC